MSIETIIDVVLTALAIVFAVVIAYKQMGNTIQSKAALLIAQAAELDILGHEKMQTVVDELYTKYVPDFFKSFMTKQKLEEISQKIYNNMKLFTQNDLKDSVYKEE